MSAAPLIPLSRGFLARLAAARSFALNLFRGSIRKTVLAGIPTEFDGHRPYLPGDDTRWIDWNLYARSEELYVKVFQVEEEVDVVVLVDASPSMTEGGGDKYRAAAAAAAAMSYLGLITSHSVSLGRFAERLLDFEGPFRHERIFPQICSHLLKPPPGEGTDLRASLKPILFKRSRPASLIVISDGLQKEPLQEVASFVQGMDRHWLVFLRIDDPADRSPALRGNLLVKDLEGTQRLHIVADRTLERELHRSIDRHLERLTKEFREHGFPLVELPVREPFESAFMDVLRAAGTHPLVT